MNSNYDHDNLLEIRKRGQVSYISRGDYGDTSTAIVRGIDPEAITREGMAANSAMVANLLKQFAPTIDAPGTRRPPVSGIASPAELSSRNERFRLTTAATVALSVVTAGGICWVAYLAGAVNEPGALAGWLTLSGLAGWASVQWTHHRESQLTPEAIELERVRGEFDIATQDGETKRIVAGAFAESIILDAQTKRDNASAQRAANMAYLERSKPVQTPQRAQPTSYEDSYQDDYEQPVCAPVAPTLATYEFAQELEFQPIQPAQPDRDLVNFLAEIDRIYAHCEGRDSDIIKIGLEWATAGKNWSQDAKEKAARVLAYFEDFTGSPLIYRPSENGAKYRLNRQQWSNKRIVKAMIAREWNN